MAYFAPHLLFLSNFLLILIRSNLLLYIKITFSNPNNYYNETHIKNPDFLEIEVFSVQKRGWVWLKV